MRKWLSITSVVIVAGVAIAVLIGQAFETTKAERLVAALVESPRSSAGTIVEFESFSQLPLPVIRYFRHALTDGQKLIRAAKIQQTGDLRTDTTTARWSSFTARQVIVPPATGFVWNARVEMLFGTHVRVLDSYIAGVGLGRVSLLSAIRVVSDAGALELNSGALHRYLAEAVWFPTALLPQSGVMWSPMSDHSAMATVSDHGTTVSLEFRFNDAGEVTGIYSDGRFGRFDGQYQRVPWEGHFRNYQVQAGMRVPSLGEVGWYDDGELRLVWRGNIVGLQYEFEE